MKALILAVLLFVPITVAAHSSTEFSDIIDSVKKSVVIIHNIPIPDTVLDQPNIKPLENPEDETHQSIFVGTGFFIEGGYIVTNQHVVDHTTTLEVFFEGNLKPYIAQLVGEDKDVDIAVLKLVNKDISRNIKPLHWRMNHIRVGEEVWAIGHPLGLNYSVSKGIVSYLDRRIASPWQPTIQSDAAVNHGNSGGPLLDMDGNVVGVNVMIVSVVNEFNGIALSVDGFTAKKVAERLIAEGEIVRPLMGVQLGYDNSAYQVKAIEVGSGSPADNGGMKEGDLYVSIDDKKINIINDIFDILSDKRPGDVIKVKVLRERKTFTLNVKLGSRTN